MKILILGLGSRGDVQPFVALALGLTEAGHQVKLATGTDFREFVEGRGVDYFPIRADFSAMARSEAGKAAIEGKSGKALATLKSSILPTFRRILDDSWAAAEGAEAIVFHPKIVGAPDIAEKLGIPAFVALPMPMLVPTRAFPHPLLPVRNLGGVVNRLTYSLNQLGLIPFRKLIDRWRRDALGLPPRKRTIAPGSASLPVLYAYSSQLIPRPDDWGPSVALTGSWDLARPDVWEPPDRLLRFLQAGPAPVYVGFGSMTGSDPEAGTRLVVEALERAGCRGVLASGWGGLSLDDLPDSILGIESIPHDWLFPRMAAVVHHGGAGTTFAGLQAGRPTVVCPHFADQPFWGRVVSRRGVGPSPIPRHSLSAERLAEAIQIATTDHRIRQDAESLRHSLCEEDGVGNAVRFIESTVLTPSS
ncbi:glycosyltransferase [Tundrisphaera lichenicola]|uniref:glycosyltransferase n=1 Tax=Tundrisphaera lichenicola TaxID=2029860 RepID=UPI003EC09600